MVKSTLGSIEMIPDVERFLKTETASAPLQATTISVLPSPSRSPVFTPSGVLAVVKSTFAAKEIVLPTEVLRSIEIELPPWLAVMISAFPSLSISSTVSFLGSAPVPKLTGVANSKKPEPVLLRITYTMFEVELAIIISSQPSPFISAVFTQIGLVTNWKNSDENETGPPATVVFL